MPYDSDTKDFAIIPGREAEGAICHLEQFKCSVRRAKHPVPILLTYTQATLDYLRTCWVETNEYATFDDLLGSTTSLAEARAQQRREEKAIPALAPATQLVPTQVSSDIHTSGSLLRERLDEIRAEYSDFPEAMQELMRVAIADHRVRVAEMTEAGQDVDEQSYDDQSDDDELTLIDALIEEAELVTNTVCFIFMPTRMRVFSSARQVQLQELTPASYERRDVQMYIHAFRAAVRRLNPAVEAPGYSSLPETVLVQTVAKAMIKGYDLLEALPYVDEFKKETLEETFSAFLNMRHTDEGVFTPPWLYCPRLPTHSIVAPRKVIDNPVELARTPGAADSAAPSRKQKKKKTCSLHGPCGHATAECKALKAREQSPLGNDEPAPAIRSAKPRCPVCHRVGHTEDKCWTAHPELKPQHQYQTRSKGPPGNPEPVVQGMVVTGSVDVPPPDIMRISGWDAQILADRGSGHSLITPEGASALQRLDPSAQRAPCDVSLVDFTKEHQIGATEAITTRFILESPALEWAVRCEERFIIVPTLGYPALLGRTLLNSLGVSNDILNRRRRAARRLDHQTR